MRQTFCPLILRLDFSNPIFAGSRHSVVSNRVYWLLIHRLLIDLKQKCDRHAKFCSLPLVLHVFQHLPFWENRGRQKSEPGA